MCISYRWASIVIFLGLSGTVPTLTVDALEPTSKSQARSPSVDDGAPSTDDDAPVDDRHDNELNPQIKRKHISPVRQPRKSPPKSTLDIFLDVIFGGFPSKGSTQRSTKRGVCPIAPGLLEAEDKIFSDRPLFVWQGNIDSIEVRDYWTGDIIQSDRITTGVTSWQYPGSSLQPGEVYVWTLKQGQRALVTREFQVMSQQEREQVIQQKAVNRGLNPLKSASLSDAAYFSDHQLWSDTLTSLHEEPDESKALRIKEKIFALGERLCNEEAAAELARES